MANNIPPIVESLCASLDGNPTKPEAFNLYNTLWDIHAYIGKSLAKYEKANGLKITQGAKKKP